MGEDVVVVIQRQDVFKALEDDALDQYLAGMLMETYNCVDSLMEKILHWLTLEWSKGKTYQQYSYEDIVAFGFYNENEMVVDFYQLTRIVPYQDK